MKENNGGPFRGRLLPRFLSLLGVFSRPLRTRDEISASRDSVMKRRRREGEDSVRREP